MRTMSIHGEMQHKYKYVIIRVALQNYNNKILNGSLYYHLSNELGIYKYIIIHVTFPASVQKHNHGTTPKQQDLGLD